MNTTGAECIVNQTDLIFFVALGMGAVSFLCLILYVYYIYLAAKLINKAAKRLLNKRNG